MSAFRPYLQSEPTAREKKPETSDLPQKIIHDIETVAQSKLTDTETVFGGYSPAFSMRAVFENGETYFIKGANPKDMSHATKMIAQEIDIYDQVDVLKQIAPPYKGHVTDHDPDGWSLGIWDFIPDARMPKIFTKADFEALGKTLRFMYAHFEAENSGLIHAKDTPFVDKLVTGQQGWINLQKSPERRDHFAKAFQNPDFGANWLGRFLDDLVNLSQKPYSPSRYISLAHFDLRHDNMVFDQQGRCYILDWPNACIGPVLHDLIYLTIDLAVQGNGAPWDIFDKIVAELHINTDIADMKVTLAQITGYYATNFYKAVPETMPRLRWLQKAMLHVSMQWLGALEGIAPLPEIAQ